MFIFTPSVSQIPLMAVKSDGYAEKPEGPKECALDGDSTDLAATYHRLLVMRADWQGTQDLYTLQLEFAMSELFMEFRRERPEHLM
eukprot:symbB.v1.2.033501.t1/scaffold4167.1/size45294/4